MDVARNCIKTMKLNFVINDINKVIKNHVYPNQDVSSGNKYSYKHSDWASERLFSSMRRVEN
jgi:hypothetical protein